MRCASRTTAPPPKIKPPKRQKPEGYEPPAGDAHFEYRADEYTTLSQGPGVEGIQTIRRDWNPLYYRAVELFGEATGVPVVLNTSFNLRGEPIVTTPLNALNTFTKSDIDTLYMNGFVIRKKPIGQSGGI